MWPSLITTSCAKETERIKKSFGDSYQVISMVEVIGPDILLSYENRYRISKKCTFKQLILEKESCSWKCREIFHTITFKRWSSFMGHQLKISSQSL